MKVAFDEHVPPGIVKVFKTLAEEGDIVRIEFVSARDYRLPKDKGDPPWLERFAKDGGSVVISGDRKMRSRPHERAALAEAGLITFFFRPVWSERTMFVKSAMLLNWWPRINEYIWQSSPSQCWEIPFQWNWTNLRDVTGETK